MEQFTASEVRRTAAAIEGKQMLVSSMLRAFAGLLEAREKAKPVMIVNHVSSAEHDLPIGMKLYTHPSPSDAEKRETMTPRELAKRIERGEKWKLADEPTPCQSRDAERLAEALRACALNWQEIAAATWRGYSVSASNVDKASANAYMHCAQDIRKALATHSAQAQPPAASVPDGFMLVRREPTQAMVDAVCKIKIARLEALRTGHVASSGIKAAVIEEWNAMLAAQESPNG